METLAALGHGFSVALTPLNLFWSLLGVTVGTAIGVLPGIGPALTVALLLPVTNNLEPTSAFIMFAGIYYGAMYGGSTTSILLNTPGESGSIVTAIDGNMMARKGRGAQALATAAIGSFVAGTIATLALTFVAPVMVKLALLFGPAEYFALMVLALTTVTAVLGDSLPRGLASLLFGLALGLVGIDLQTGQARFTLGIPELLDGIDTVVVAVGLFAVGETLFNAARFRFEKEEMSALTGSMWMSKEDWARSWKPWLRGTAFGFPIGTLPAGGSEIPTFLSYLTEKRLAKNPEEFGQGAIEAVAGPEAANNAAAAGTLAPLLSLGLPTSATAAIMLAAFQQYGLQPGPLLFENNPDLVWGMIASEAVESAQTLALRRHSHLRDPRGVHLEQQRGRPRRVVGHWPDRLRHEGAGCACRAGRRRLDPRSVGRTTISPCAFDQSGRSVSVLHSSHFGGDFDHRTPAGPGPALHPAAPVSC
jgi:putative tricarboxylic transport membrane protein